MVIELKNIQNDKMGREDGGGSSDSVGSEGILLQATKTKRSIALTSSGAGPPVLQVTNEYGNSVSYELDDRQFDGLWSNLWQYVKDNQH